MRLSDIVKYSLLFIIPFCSQFYVEYIHASKPVPYISYQNFTPPDRSTPTNTVKTFWWALRMNNELRINECINQDRFLEDYVDWPLSIYLDQFRNIDQSDFVYSEQANYVTISSSIHNMNYEMEQESDGQWIITKMVH